MSRGYLVGKLVHALVTIGAILVLNFALFRILPGDPVRTMLPRGIPADQIAATRTHLGLDLPLFPNQFLSYGAATLTGDLGFSFQYRIPVSTLLTQRAGPTVLLVGSASLLAIVIGIVVGTIAGGGRGGWFDNLTVGTSLVLYALPVFWLGMIAIMIFGPLGFPINGMLTPGFTAPDALGGLGDGAAHLFMPAVVLAVGLIGQYALFMRSALVDVMTEDYIETARAKGLREEQVLVRHAVRNALLPTITLIGINLGIIFAGAITLEDVFGWPGLGSLIVTSVASRDYPVLEGTFLLIAVTVVAANLAADIVYGLLDPRVRG
jgi:peptide/nickel transport system permease protein